MPRLIPEWTSTKLDAHKGLCDDFHGVPDEQITVQINAARERVFDWNHSQVAASVTVWIELGFPTKVFCFMFMSRAY